MSKLYRNIVLMLSLGLFLVGLIFSNPLVLLNSVLIMLVHNLWYAMEDFYKRVIFFVFNSTFLIFLVGRMVVNALFNYKESPNNLFGLNFNEVYIVNHMLIALYISVFCLYIGFLLIKSFQKNDMVIENSRESEKVNRLSFKIFSKYFFYFTFIFRLMYLIEQRSVAISGGYYETFASFQSQMPGIFVLLSEMNDVALFAFLASRPNKKESILPIGLYLLDGTLALLAGRRSGFMLNILVIFIYFCLRNINSKENFTERIRGMLKKEKWIGKRHLVGAILATPAILILLNTIGIVRGGAGDINITIIDSILEFFYAQGVSANVIGYTMVLENSIPEGKLYSLGPILQFFANYIGYFINGIPMPTGQTVDLALNGYLFSHTISYLIMPNLYLNGVGYGSSYIAELYADFGYIGVAIGSIIYGILIGKFFVWFRANNIILTMITLLMVRSFLFTPRAATISFIVSTFSPSKIIAMIIIILGSIIIKAFFLEKENINTKLI